MSNKSATKNKLLRDITLEVFKRSEISIKDKRQIEFEISYEKLMCAVFTAFEKNPNAISKIEKKHKTKLLKKQE